VNEFVRSLMIGQNFLHEGVQYARLPEMKLRIGQTVTWVNCVRECPVAVPLRFPKGFEPRRFLCEHLHPDTRVEVEPGSRGPAGWPRRKAAARPRRARPPRRGHSYRSVPTMWVPGKPCAVSRSRASSSCSMRRAEGEAEPQFATDENRGGRDIQPLAGRGRRAGGELPRHPARQRRQPGAGRPGLPRVREELAARRRSAATRCAGRRACRCTCSVVLWQFGHSMFLSSP
jgi:hypothetical protein